MQQKHPPSYGLFIAIGALVVFRFCYSLTTEFWFNDQDVLQIYLIGLKSFTTHQWPFFGADLVYNGSQIPGALQGLLVSGLWYVWKIPEAPFVLLNVLLDISLGILAWYSAKRLPKLSKLAIVSYIFLVPWSICYFTKIVNPSYVIPGAIVFFIAIFEIYPSLTINILPKGLCFYALGFAIFWIMQLHMSWVLLGPFTAVAFFYLLRTKDIRLITIRSAQFLAGCLTTGSLLIPTLLNYGFSNGNGKSVSAMAELHFDHAADIFHWLSTYVAYASFDVTRFIGGDTAGRSAFLKDYVWAAPFTLFVAVVGVAQAIYLLVGFARPFKRDKSTRSVARLAALGFLLFAFVSLFSRVSPPSHAAVLFFPMMILYSLHVFSELTKYKVFRILVTSVLISTVLMEVGVAIKNYRTISLYTNREPVVKALETDNYTLVGKRRYEQ